MRIKAFITKHLVPAVSLAVMLLSFSVTLPTGEMIVSLEWSGLVLGFVMTLTIAGLRKEGIMNSLGRSASVFSHLGAMAAFFAVMAFILSPFITSLFAVSSILPLAASMLEKRERKEEIPAFAAIITLSAIAGGTILPAGSWHNMLLHMTLGDASFLKVMLPYFLASVPVIAISIPLLLGKRITERLYINENIEENAGNKGMRMLYVCFAFITLLSSLSLFRWIDILIFTLAILLVFDRSVFLKADYSAFLSMLFLSIAGRCFSPLLSQFLQNGLLWKGIVATEIFGGLPVAAFAEAAATDPVSILKAVNIGSAGTVLSLPALCALKRLKKEDRKTFAIKYSAISIILLAIFIAVSAISG